MAGVGGQLPDGIPPSANEAGPVCPNSMDPWEYIRICSDNPSNFPESRGDRTCVGTFQRQLSTGREANRRPPSPVVASGPIHSINFAGMKIVAHFCRRPKKCRHRLQPMAAKSNLIPDVEPPFGDVARSEVVQCYVQVHCSQMYRARSSRHDRRAWGAITRKMLKS
jgi:hypothetical protein